MLIDLSLHRCFSSALTLSASYQRKVLESSLIENRIGCLSREETKKRIRVSEDQGRATANAN